MAFFEGVSFGKSLIYQYSLCTMNLFKMFIPVTLFAVMVVSGACSNEPPYLPAAERPENQQGNDENNDNNSGKPDNKPDENDDGNQGGDEAGEGSLANGHGCVDLGLSVNWATSNIDAFNPAKDSDPKAPGTLFKWGAITPVNSSEAATSFPSVPDETDIAGTSCDAATALWGVPWRMPTEEEFAELISVCEVTWENSGYRFTAPNGSSIYLPAAGYCDFLTDTSIYDFIDPSVSGRYWSANSAISLNFTKPDRLSGQSVTLSRNPRYCACSIRPVCPK